LTTKVADIDILCQYVFVPMTKMVFESERSAWEISYFSKQENIQELNRIAARIFYTLSLKESNLKSLLASLKTFHTDVLFRFFVHCVDSRDHLSASHMGLALLTLIRSDLYHLPLFCSKYFFPPVSKVSIHLKID